MMLITLLYVVRTFIPIKYIHLTKTTAALNEDALSNYTVRGLYFLAVVFVRCIVHTVAAHMLVTELFSRAILVYFPLSDANIHFYVAFHRNIRE